MVSELFFVPSKKYTQVKQTIIEYCIFERKQYLLFGVTEEDSQIEFLEIQNNFYLIISNTKKIIDKSLLTQNQSLQLYDLKGSVDKVYVVCNSSQQGKQINTFLFLKEQWLLQDTQQALEFRGLELGYSFINQSVRPTYLKCQQDSCQIISDKGSKIFQNFTMEIKRDSQIKYTLNYLIVLQDNVIIVTTLQKSAQRTNIVEGTLLKIDVDFQNDILIVFTNTKIMTYHLQQATLSYQSHEITTTLDLVTIQAKSGQHEQTANIHFQVLSKLDYNLYLSKDLNQDLFYNQEFYSKKFIIPLQGISGADIKVDGKVDEQLEIIPNQIQRYQLEIKELMKKKKIIYEQLMTSNDALFIFRQYDDFMYQVYYCQLKLNSYVQLKTGFFDYEQKQKVTLQYVQVAQQELCFAVLNSDGLEIKIQKMNKLMYNFRIKPQRDDKFVNMQVGTDRLFVYTLSNLIQFYHFPSGQFISEFDLHQFGKPIGEMRKLWVNQAKTNLLILTYGEELLIGRFTTQFIFIQRITIKWVIDVSIIADNKFIVLSTDKKKKKLTQYIIEEGTIRIQRELDAHGFVVVGDNILSDNVFGEIMIQAKKGNQKALLVFGDSELQRDSLLKVIHLYDDEYAVNVVFHQGLSSLLIRSTDSNKNSSIMDLNYTHQDSETNLIKDPIKFSQLQDLKYIYRSSFAQNNVEIMKKIYIEYQFQNISVKQSEINLTYENESQLIIPIQPDTFYGQVKSLYLKQQDDNHIQLTTRFKIQKEWNLITNRCYQVVQFERILCHGDKRLKYLNLNGENVMELLLDIELNVCYTKFIQSTGWSIQTIYFTQMILQAKEQYALIRTGYCLMLIYLSENEIQLSQTHYDLNIQFDISIFYKKWLVVYNKNSLIYYKFQTQANDQWQIEKESEYFIQGIKQIQYDSITESIFYQTGDQKLSYFKSSLEGDTINKQPEYSLNIQSFLESLQVYQKDPIIQNIKIVQQQKKSYILVSTSYGNIWNITIKTSKQDFQMNNMFIVIGPSPIGPSPIGPSPIGPSSTVIDVQVMDDYVLVQNKQFQSLYKNTYDRDFNEPSLPLEGINAYLFMALFKNGTEIIHIHDDMYGYEFYQNIIDDNVFLTIAGLDTYSPDNISICAFNFYGQSQVNFYLINEKKQEEKEKQKKQEKKENFLKIVWISAIFILAIAFIAMSIRLYYFSKNRRQLEEPLIEGNREIEFA